MSAITDKTKPNLRIMLSSARMRDAAVALVAALLLALAFPRAGIAWCAPLGIAALFFAWKDASWKRAFGLGWFAGWIFFSISFWWWSTTIQTAVGGLAYIAVLAAAAIEAVAIGAAGALYAFARTRCAPPLLPLAGAAAFTITEWLRSIGALGVPFGQLGYTQADTPLRIFAAYIGTIGVTFVVCTIGAYAADALARRTWRPLAAATATIVCALAIAWLAWPARSAPPPRIPVAAIQGNIAQSLKWQPGALALAVQRYTSMTRVATTNDPRIIVWPETVIAEQGRGLNQDPALVAAFTRLAQRANATIIAGSIDVHDRAYYNALFFFTPRGISGIYDKRQLVPFAEDFPGKRFLWWLPYIGSLEGNFASGTGPTVFQTTAGLTVAPMICWESAFSDLAFGQLRRGAKLLVVSTDDAWFGTSSGPYQHAQIAQLRAIEAGSYLIRAAATGISGIISPNGTWLERAPLDVQRIVYGNVGPPVGSFFSHIGPTSVWFALIALYLVLVWRRNA
jgi:apolipoprotein N-acyltransferase